MQAAPRDSAVRGLARNLALAALFVAIPLTMKFSSFGDTNRAADDLFYFLVGQRMHEGVLPYVDVWDRKPLGLFLIYYLLAGVSKSVLFYQIAACFFAGATAFIIARIVYRWAGWTGALFAGLAYLGPAVLLEGASGQAPDFYNPLIAAAALLIASQFDDLAKGRVNWPIWSAMALCGIAITIKQTSFFEAIFFGLYILVSLFRANVSPRRIAMIGAGFAAIGALPSLTIAAFYWQAGHWPEFWQAMVTSNLTRGTVGNFGFRLVGITLRLALLLAFALWALVAACPNARIRAFLGIWLVAALIGFVAVPNAAVHYALPVLVPLSVLTGLLLGSHSRRLIMAIALALYTALWYQPASLAHSRENAAAMRNAAGLIKRHDGGGGLFVLDGPSYLYALSGKRFLTPLVFPHHLASALESNVSHLNTHAEVDRVLKGRPGVVVIAVQPYIYPANVYSRTAAKAYAEANCRQVGLMTLYDAGQRVPFQILGDCGGNRDPRGN